MLETHTYLDFVYLPTFERTTKGLFTDAEQRRLEDMLLQDPEAGRVVQGTGGVRKIRVALPGRGKSGGARVIYYFRVTRHRVYLILAYPKNVKDTLTAREKSVMRALTSQLEAEP
jgi:hypothetical protein